MNHVRTKDHPSRYGTTRRGTLLLLAALIALPIAAADEKAEQQPPPAHAVVRGAERSAPVTPLFFDGDVRDLPSPVQWDQDTLTGSSS